MPQSLKKTLDKLEFAEPIQAHVVRGILSPEGGITIAQSGAALAAACEGVASEQRETRSPELWVWNKK